MSRSVRLFCGALVLVVIASVTAGCQVAKAGAACHTSALAHDNTYILQCSNGHWKRTMTMQQAATNVLNALKPKSTTTTAAPAQAAAAVATTTTAPATTTTVPHTTTTVPASTTTTTVPPTTTTLPPAPKTNLVSLDGTAPAGGDSTAVGVSDDGRYVVYDELSAAGIIDGWKRDLQTGTVTKVTVTNAEANYPNGGTALAMSTDARYVVFVQSSSLELRDTTKGTTVAVGPAATASTMTLNAAISADGRYVAYLSNGPSIVSGDTNGAFDVFVWDRQAGTTERASVTGSNTQLATGAGAALAMSSDGRYVVFSSVPGTDGSNQLYRRDVTKNTTVEVGLSTAGVAPNGLTGTSILGEDGAAISTDGNTVAFDSDADNLVTGDTNGVTDVFVRNVSAATTTRVSVTSGGVEATGVGSLAPIVSSDGRYVFFTSFATNLVAGSQAADVYVHDMTTGSTGPAAIAADGTTVGNGFSQGVQISSSGRYVAFSSQSTNLVASPTVNGTYYQVYMNDRGA